MEWLPVHEKRLRTCCFLTRSCRCWRSARVGNGKEGELSDDAEYAEVSHRRAPVSAGTVWGENILLLLAVSPPSQRCSACQVPDVLICRR
ncbi:hypothetical protein KCP75_02605 [Salmonella enterica subsp. enterica]|nr:hypothetical protein KCP75_02605 [Salmonella enterica subsp. enterica]